MPQPPRTALLPLVPAAVEKWFSLPDTRGLRIRGKLEAADAPGLPPSTRALSMSASYGLTPDRA